MDGSEGWCCGLRRSPGAAAGAGGARWRCGSGRAMKGLLPARRRARHAVLQWWLLLVALLQKGVHHHIAGEF